MKSKIEWCDSTLNCITGCTRQSDGCAHCYALRQSYRCAAMGMEKYQGVTEKKGKVLDWTGKIALHPEVLDQPKNRKVPTRYFVNSMSDTFHPTVPFDFIDKIFQMCLNNPCHEFMILTKRPENVIDYISNSLTRSELIAQSRNVIIMSTVENQEVASSRLRALTILKSRIPGLPIGLSCEPLLGPINFGVLGMNLINWCIVGAETGPRSRFMNPDWARGIKKQCEKFDIPFFIKKMSKKEPIPDDLLLREFPNGK